MNKQDNQRQAILYSYMAGILDGEGSIGIQKITRKINWSPTYTAFISVVNTEKDIVELFRKEFTPKYKCIVEYSKHNYRSIYRWRTPGNQLVVSILEKLLPYLRIKKEKAEIVIKYCKNKRVTGFERGKKVPIDELSIREEYFQKLKYLNRRGIAAATTKREDTFSKVKR